MGKGGGEAKLTFLCPKGRVIYVILGGSLFHRDGQGRGGELDYQTRIGGTNEGGRGCVRKGA